MEELIGNQLGQYRIEAKIGRGAMATVFRAYQSSLDRYVAVKVMPASLASEYPAFVKRFQREAKSIARLHHPNILPVYDFGIDQDYSYIVMRYVEGAQTLSHIVYQPSNGAPNFDPIIQVANALAYAHKHGVIHRDIKPGNVLLDNGWALLTDFGLAKATEFTTRLTEAGKSIGTPAYMSPEQARGYLVDYRTDIYALGVILYEMLTNTLPHDAETPLGILLKRTTESPPPPRTLNPAIPEQLDRVVVRALAPDPEDRFRSAEHFAEALKAAIAEPSSRPPAFGIPDSRATDVLSTGPISTHLLDSQQETSPETLDSKRAPNKLPGRIWFVGLGAGIGALALVLWGGSFFGSTASQLTPTQTVSIIAAAPTSTSTPTFTPVSTPTHTSMPPTHTLSPTPSSTSTSTPQRPTATPLLVVVTATATRTPTVEPSPTPNSPTATPTLTPTPTDSLPTGTFTLLNPVSLENPSYGLTNFEWEWTGPVPAGFGFEVRIWREGEPQVGAHDAILDNQQGRIERIHENRYRLNINIRQAAGVRERTGEYLWTVALVQVSPGYVSLGQQAEPVYLRFEAGGGSNSGGSNSGGGNVGGID